MFEDKRFKNDNSDNSNNFFMPDNTGLREGNENLNFGEQAVYRKPIKPKKERKPRNTKLIKILLVIFILCALVVSGYFVFIKVFNNPYNVYKNVINYGYDYLDNKIKDMNSKTLNYDKNKDIISTSGSLTISTNLMEELKDYKLEYKLGIDLSKEIFDANLLIKQNNKKVLDFNGYLRDKKILLNLKDVYNKYLQVGEISNLESIKESNIDYSVLNDILKNIKNALEGNLDKNKMSSLKTKIKIQNKSLSVISNNYKLSSNEVKELYQDLINGLINDSKVIDKLADMFNLRKAEIKDILESLKDNTVILDNLKELEFRIYTNGIANNVVGGKILYDGKEFIDFTNYKNDLDVNVSREDNDFKVDKNNKDTKLVYNLGDKELLSIIITKKNDKTNYEFNIEYDKTEIEGNLEIEVLRVANKRVTTNIVFDTKGKIDKDNFDLKINLNNITQVGGTIESIPNNNISIYNDLSAAEKREIQVKYNNIVNNIPFGYLFKINEDEITDYCEIATDCNCLGAICTCSYLDKDGVEQKINCLNKNA